MKKVNIPWTEKYRPHKLDEIIIQDSLRNIVQKTLDDGAENLPNMIFSGSAGTGKTSLAKLIAKQLNIPHLYINASDETGIEVIRNKVRTFSTNMTVDGKIKLVICDEADRLSIHAQDAMKGITEQFYKTTRYIFTCNHPERIIDPLKSRMKEITFKPVSLKLVSKRISEILKHEKIHVSEEQKPKLIDLIKKQYPDMRRIIHHLQCYSVTGDLEIDNDIENDIIQEIIEKIKTKSLSDIRSIIRNNKWDYDIIVKSIFDMILDNEGSFKGLNEGQRAQIILICCEHLYRASTAVDKEVSFASFAIEVMKTL